MSSRGPFGVRRLVVIGAALGLGGGVASIGLLSATTAPAGATTAQLYVATIGSDSNFCTQTQPCLTIARAVSVAGTTPTTINVAAGAYTSTSTIDLPAGVNLTIAGAGAATTTVGGTKANPVNGSVFQIENPATVSITGLTITYGNAPNGGGGGILNLGSIDNLSNDVITANAANGGGGIYQSGTISNLTNDVITGNNAGNSGGGILTLGGTTITTLRNDTISGNTATSGDGGGIVNGGGNITTFSNDVITANTATDGGGVWNSGVISPVNVTVSGNTATGNSGFPPAGGGGVENAGGITLSNDTIADNRAPNGEGGGIDEARGGTGAVGATIVAANSGGNCNAAVSHDSGYNLEDTSTSSCGFVSGVNGDIVGLNAQLGALADNGGPVKTMALLAGSPAVDIVPAANCPSTDARGFPRPDNSERTCDIGAYETQHAAPAVTGVNPNLGPVTGGTPITITGTNFTPGAKVVIGQGNGTTGAIPATSVKVVSRTKITAKTGGGAKPGTWNLFVTTSGGTSAANSRALFAYK